MLSHDELALKPTLTTLNFLMKSLSEEFEIKITCGAGRWKLCKIEAFCIGPKILMVVIL